MIRRRGACLPRSAWIVVSAFVAAGFAAVAADTPVADAAARGDNPQVLRLLRSGEDVNSAQGDGMTALLWASDRGDAELVEALLTAGAHVNAGTRIGRYTSLHIAAGRGHVEVVELLLGAKADVDARTTNSGVTPLHLAARSGKARVVEALLSAGAEVNARETSWGQTPLVFASSAGRVEATRALLAAGADGSLVSRTVDVAQMEKADKAANKRVSEMLATFKEQDQGGDDWQPTPNQVQVAIEASRRLQRDWGRDDKKKKSASASVEEDVPLSAEADTGEPSSSPPKAATEASGPPEKDPKDRDENPPSYGELVKGWGGLTPLLHAVRQGHRDVAAVLLESGVDIDQPSAGDRTTPLLMAAINGQFDLARMLLERGANPNLASTAGATPLFAVLERQWAPRASYAHPIEHQQQDTTHLELLEALLTSGADANVRIERHLWYSEHTFGVLRGAGIDYTGATPFWRAAYALDLDAMRLLKEHGADPSIPTLQVPRRRRGGDSGLKKKVSGALKKVVHLVGLGNPEVPVGGPNIHALHAASGVGYGQSFAGNAHRHVPDNWVPAVKFLIEECGVDVDLRDANGYTALHHAASRGDNDLVRYLVDQGADVKAKSRKGQTTADMANGPIQRVAPFPETIALLVSLGAKNNHNCVSC